MHDNSIDLFGAPPTKFCKLCKQHLPFEAFHLMTDRRGHRYRQSWCKKCKSRRWAEWNKTPHGQGVVKRARRRRGLREAFNLSTTDYAAMLAAQDGVCAICHKPETRNFKGRVCPLAVDHDHATGKVRALLCHACNKGIGFFNDDLKLLRAAILYLERHA